MKRINNILKITVVLFLTSVLASCGVYFQNDVNYSLIDENELSVHYFDVGEGDSEFVELPQGKCMLIDAGEKRYGDDVADRIEALGYSKIDFLVITHPHSDHIGGMSEIVDSFEIGEVYMPKVINTTDTYKNFLSSVSEKKMKVNSAASGKMIYTSSQGENELCVKILAPNSNDYDELNNYSVVVKLTYGENSFLFTGDAEVESEREMLELNKSELDSDVLKVGHHGSKSSTSKSFIDAVSPYYAVISCSSDNSYGHPHSEVLKILSRAPSEIYRTDECSTITFSCCGDGDYDITYGEQNGMDN